MRKSRFAEAQIIGMTQKLSGVIVRLILQRRVTR